MPFWAGLVRAGIFLQDFTNESHRLKNYRLLWLQKFTDTIAFKKIVIYCDKTTFLTGREACLMTVRSFLINLKILPWKITKKKKVIWMRFNDSCNSRTSSTASFTIYRERHKNCFPLLILTAHSRLIGTLPIFVFSQLSACSKQQLSIHFVSFQFSACSKTQLSTHLRILPASRVLNNTTEYPSSYPPCFPRAQ